MTVVAQNCHIEGEAGIEVVGHDGGPDGPYESPVLNAESDEVAGGLAEVRDLRRQSVGRFAGWGRRRFVAGSARPDYNPDLFHNFQPA